MTLEHSITEDDVLNHYYKSHILFRVDYDPVLVRIETDEEGTVSFRLIEGDTLEPTPGQLILRKIIKEIESQSEQTQPIPKNEIPDWEPPTEEEWKAYQKVMEGDERRDD